MDVRVKTKRLHFNQHIAQSHQSNPVIESHVVSFLNRDGGWQRTIYISVTQSFQSAKYRIVC